MSNNLGESTYKPIKETESQVPSLFESNPNKFDSFSNHDRKTSSPTYPTDMLRESNHR